MKEPNPEWYRGLQNEPFARRTFTMDNILRIEEKVAKMERERGRAGRRAWRWAVGSLAGVALFIGAGMNAGWFSASDNTNVAIHSPQPMPSVKPDPNALGANRQYYRLKSEVEVLEKPDAYGSMPALFVAQPDGLYEVKDRQGTFVRVVNLLHSSTEMTGWIPEWYLTPDGSDKADKPDPYEMIVKTPAAFRLYPDEPKPSGFELEPGKVVQVTAKYGNWMRVNIVTYDSPYAGDKWVPVSALEAWDPAKAKEGTLKSGAAVYNEAGQALDDTSWLFQIRIDGESGGRYRIGAAGGFTGFIDKKDFIPNPFVLKLIDVIDQSGEQPDPDWLVSRDESQSYSEFVKKKSDELLKDKRPIEIFRYYVTSIRRGDYKTAYALFIQGSEYGTPELETYLSDIQSDPDTRERDKSTWEDRMQHLQIEEQINGDTASIVMTDGSNNPENSISFGLTKNKTGVWKVNWLPTQ